MPAPSIVAFGDADHNSGETGLVADVAGAGPFPGSLWIYENADRTGAADQLTVGAWNSAQLTGISIPFVPNNTGGTRFLFLQRADLAWSLGFPFTLNIVGGSVAFQYKNRVRGTSTTTGTGTYTIGAAPSGYQSFSQLTSSNQVYYCVVLGANWEVGIGTVTVGGSTTLSRDTILESSNSGAAVNWGAGSKDVFLVDPAEALAALTFDGTLRHGDFTGALKGGAIFLTGVVIPAGLSGITDDWAPTLTHKGRVQLSCAAASELTGMAGGEDGKEVTLTNVGSESLILRDEAAGSTAANRFGMNGDQLLPANTSMRFLYDGSISRWSKLS